MTRSKPISVYVALITVLAISTQTLAETGIPIWQLHNDGSFDLKAGSPTLTGCYPAIDGHSVFAKSVTVHKNDKGGRIIYQLAEGKLVLDFSRDADSATLSTTIKGLDKAPHWIYPLAQAKVAGTDRYYKQGIGFAGPSGIRKIKASVIRRESRTADETMSFDSYLSFALISPDDITLALAAYKHSNYLQRTTFYNRQYRYGLIDRWLDSDTWFVEAGFATENIAVPTSILKLPNLHFVTGTKPFDTMRHLAKNIAKANSVKLDKPTSYHWCSWYDAEKNFSIDKLETFLAGLKTIDPPTPIMAVQIDDYCNYGDQRILVAVRQYPDRNAWGVLFVNPSDQPATETYQIKDLIEKPSALCFTWLPAQNKPLGKLSSLTIDLKPHASILYYVSPNDTPPHPDMTLSGLTVPALSDSQ